MKVSSIDIASGIIGAGMAAGMYWYAGTFPERAASAALYIRFLSAVLGLFSIMLLGRAAQMRRKEDGTLVKWVDHPAVFSLTAGLLVVYIILMTVLGFFLSSLLFMCTLAWILGFRKIIPLAIGSISLLVVIYFLFVRFLSVPVPAGIF